MVVAGSKQQQEGGEKERKGGKRKGLAGPRGWAVRKIFNGLGRALGWAEWLGNNKDFIYLFGLVWFEFGLTEFERI
jgi:hypothetical protein